MNTEPASAHPRLSLMMRTVLLAAIVPTVHGLAAPIGASSPRRMLLLHGSGSSAGAFPVSPTAMGGKEFLAGVPRRTDAGTRAPPNWIYSGLDEKDGYWYKEDGKFTGLQQSIESVEAAILEQGIVGIVGHEQGATLAALVAARAALGEGPPLKFAVICGAEMPAGPHAALLERLKETPGASLPCSLRTLHCIGSVEREAGEAVAACFGAAELLFHERGAALPDRNWWEETRGFPERVTGGRYWCTQHRGPWPYKASELVLR